MSEHFPPLRAPSPTPPSGATDSAIVRAECRAIDARADLSRRLDEMSVTSARVARDTWRHARPYVVASAATLGAVVVLVALRASTRRESPRPSPWRKHAPTTSAVRATVVAVAGLVARRLVSAALRAYLSRPDGRPDPVAGESRATRRLPGGSPPTLARRQTGP
jgi:hypothetical protein